MSENMQKNFLLDFQTYSVCKKQHNADYVNLQNQVHIFHSAAVFFAGRNDINSRCVDA